MSTSRKFRRHSFGAGTVTALVVMATAAAPPRTYAQGGPNGLFRDGPSTLAALTAGDGRALRSRSVMVDIAQIARAGKVRSAADVAPTLSLNLFSDVTVAAVLDRVDTPDSGFVWVGHVQGLPQSSVTLALVGNVMAGTVVTADATFTIRYTGNTHVIAQVDQTSFPSELPPLNPPGQTSTGGGPNRVGGAAAPATTTAPETQSDNGSTIDVMVLYTPAVVAFRGSDAAAQALVNLGISETNTSYANSGITQRVRLVYAGQVAYTESGDMSADLTNVQSDSGIAGVRNTYAADLVSVWVHYPATQVCGIAYLMSSISTSFAPAAYSVVDDECVSPNYSFAHEMGHNMGARHDWFVDAGVTPSTYAHGYVYVPGAWRTIMAYNNECVALGFNCTRLLAWASPTHTFNGVPMGVAGGTTTSCIQGYTGNPPCDADDARLLNETAFTVANFRQSPLAVSSFTPTPASPS